jgi:Protein of unknown function (DUF2971)
MEDYFYRYRPIEAVLDKFQELENQEIYFSTTDELNDPMEGFKDLVWAGDQIVWRNLLKHYILCFLLTANYAFISAEQFDGSDLRSFVRLVPQELPEAPIREIYQRVLADFLKEPAVTRFVEIMASRTTSIRRSELTGYLRALHRFALEALMKEYSQRGVFPVNAVDTLPPREDMRRNAIVMMEGITKLTSHEDPAEKISDTMFGALEATNAQVALATEYLLPDRDKRMGIVFLTLRFPAAYVAALEKLVHRDWYVACFAKTAENHSMWSTYAGGHRGVCLMFKATANARGVPTLVIERTTGAAYSKGSTTTYTSSMVPHELQPVQYASQYPVVDFFRSLGSISGSSIDGFWYRGEDSTLSECHSAVYADQDDWRERYWKTFANSTLCKTREWAHEEEHRIVVHSMFDMSAPEKRKLKYRFSDLAGIVFGARTDVEDKLKIMRIVDAKCAKDKRSDFKFYEIRYLHMESRFKLSELGLLKINYS